jgi:hypothetical protein
MTFEVRRDNHHVHGSPRPDHVTVNLPRQPAAVGLLFYHQEVQVTFRPRLSPGGGAEEVDLPRLYNLRRITDGLVESLCFFQVHGSILLGFRFSSFSAAPAASPRVIHANLRRPVLAAAEMFLDLSPPKIRTSLSGGTGASNSFPEARARRGPTPRPEQRDGSFPAESSVAPEASETGARVTPPSTPRKAFTLQRRSNATRVLKTGIRQALRISLTAAI